jgi:4-azaleucine resistance transporter AzlC
VRAGGDKIGQAKGLSYFVDRPRTRISLSIAQRDLVDNVLNSELLSIAQRDLPGNVLNSELLPVAYLSKFLLMRYKIPMEKGGGKTLFLSAFKYSIPVLLGYLAIGVAFGLLLVDAGYPWWIALLMSVVMYAGAGQYLAVGFFASGATLTEAALVQLVVNARHIAYGITMLKKFNRSGPYKPYLIFALTDETFALLSSIEDGKAEYGKTDGERGRFMFYVAVLDQIYWVAGSLIGAFAGTLLPVNMDGVGFALTALFIVLMIEQIERVRKPLPFIISAAAAVLAVFLLPARVSLLAALAAALATVQIFTGKKPDRAERC